MSNRKATKKIRPIVKLCLCIIYIITIMILVISAFGLYKKDIEIVKWKDVTSTKEYSYINASQMSEAFASTKDDDKQFHFVIEKTKTGKWYTYIVAINKNDYNKYKGLIDYTYERTDVKPNNIKIYGYPSKITNDIKKIAIKNIKNFVPIENEVIITIKNFEQYLTNTYLDTTIEKTHSTNYIIVTLLIMAFVLFILIIFTIFDKDKIVDEVDEIIQKEMNSKKKKSNKNKVKKRKNKTNEEKIKSNTTKKKEANSKKNKKQQKSKVTKTKKKDIEVL